MAEKRVVDQLMRILVGEVRLCAYLDDICH
jgi:hypothetical protein